MENLELWNSWREVPADALKDFDNGEFQGTDINTIWRMKVLTEQFGVCGFGWYYEIKRLWTETAGQDVFAFAEIELFIKIDNEWSKGISGTGGNKLVRMTKSGTSSTSDEAYKMAVTDAFGVACKNLGIGADVYWDNDRTKYTSQFDSKLIAECNKLGIDVRNVAKYYKISFEELTNDLLKQAIEMKKGV